MRALVDPHLGPGKFRKATATATFAAVAGSMDAVPNAFEFFIEEVRASLDDETGKVELRIDVTLAVTNGNSICRICSAAVITDIDDAVAVITTSANKCRKKT